MVQLKSKHKLLSKTKPFLMVKPVDSSNSDSVFKNLMVALDLYSKDENLDQRFEAHQHLKHDIFFSRDMRFSRGVIISQPDTVKQTFRAALDPEAYRGLLQTIQAIEEAIKASPQDPLVFDKQYLEIGKEIVALIKIIKSYHPNLFERS